MTEEKQEEPRIVYSGPIKVELKLADLLEEFARQLVFERLRETAAAAAWDQIEKENEDG